MLELSELKFASVTFDPLRVIVTFIEYHFEFPIGIRFCRFCLFDFRLLLDTKRMNFTILGLELCFSIKGKLLVDLDINMDVVLFGKYIWTTDKQLSRDIKILEKSLSIYQQEMKH